MVLVVGTGRSVGFLVATSNPIHVLLQKFHYDLIDLNSC